MVAGGAAARKRLGKPPCFLDLVSKTATIIIAKIHTCRYGCDVKGWAVDVV